MDMGRPGLRAVRRDKCVVGGEFQAARSHLPSSRQVSSCAAPQTAAPPRRRDRGRSPE